MENIYNVWADYSETQKNKIQGESADKALAQISEASSQLKNLEYPKNEDWRYVSFKSLENSPLTWSSYAGESKQVASDKRIVIEISQFNESTLLQSDLLPKGLTLLSHLEALEQGKLSLENQEFNFDNPFFSSSNSFFGHGVYIEFDKNFDGSQPVEIKFNLNQQQQKDLVCPFNLTLVSESANNPTLFLSSEADSFSGLYNLTMKAKVSKGANVNVFAKETGGPTSHCLFNVLAEVAAEGKFSLMDMTFPSLWSRHNIDVRLLEKGAETSIQGAYFNDKENFCDHHTSIQHQKGHTESFEDYRGILSGKAKAVFNGKVLIDEKASQSNSEQLNKNLMLSKTAEVNTKPELQIYNDDVKAAHGATVGQLDEEQRFYLQSRGYSSSQAARILSKAFIYDLLKDCSEDVVEFYNFDIDQSLKRLEDS